MDDGLFATLDTEETVEELRRQVRKQFRVYVVVVGVVSLIVGGLIGAFARPRHLTPDDTALTPPAYWDTVSVAPVSEAGDDFAIAVTPLPVNVYVTGAVADPGVIEVPAGSLLADAIDAAGGATSDADLEAINLAAPLRDNQHVIVPRNMAQAAVETAAETGSGAILVNINTATTTELEILPHIGPAMAQRIIDYREANGPFARIEDLQNVAGIGESRYADLAPLITVGEGE
jgi:competence protein ComEA